MKYTKIFRILGVALVLAILLAAIPVLPALAAVSIVITPTQAQVGTRVDYSGSGYTASTAEYFVDIYISDQSVALLSVIDTHVTRYKKLVYGCDLEDDGSFSSYFNVPTTLNEGTVGTASPLTLTASSICYIYVTDRYVLADAANPNKTIRAMATLTIAQGATLDPLSPDSGPAGTSVLVTGFNFPASTALVFYFDTTTITPTSGHTSTLSNGLFLSYITIPSTATVGTHTVNVTAGTGASAVTASTNFIVTASATIALSVAQGAAGSTVTVTGSSFLASTPLVFKFDTTTITPTSGDTSTSASGTFYTIIAIPASATVGTHTITATAGASTDSENFIVTSTPTTTPPPTATLNALNPNSGPTGTNVAISGSNFAASSAIIVKFDTTTLTLSGTTQTGANGSFSGVIIIPSNATAGAHTITVTIGGIVKTANFSVTQSPTTPPAETFPLDTQLSGNFVGASISIASSGFSPNSVITISIDGKNITQRNATESGLFFVTLTLPSLQHGEHTITASDGAKTATANFTMESTAPGIPLPLLPAMGEAISSPASFDWSDVDDASKPVTYNLQIATTNTFTPESILINTTNLTGSQYTLTEAEQLKLSSEITYYWRERSVDAALNASSWTGAGEFTMIKPFEFIGWPLYLTIGLGGLVLFLLGLWVGRRTAFFY